MRSTTAARVTTRMILALILMVPLVATVPVGHAGASERAVTGTRTRAVGSTTCRADAGRLAVAVVVVHGDGATPVVRCVELAAGSNGFDALRGAGFGPRVERGFVCGIDGIPATGCATGPGFDGSYWRYFRGGSDGRWKYATTGAGSRLAVDDGCAYEGWVWSGQQEVVPPGIVPSSIGCVHAPPVTTPPTTTPRPTPTTTPVVTGGGTSGVGRPGGPSTGEPSSTAGGGGDANRSGATTARPEDTPAVLSGGTGSDDVPDGTDPADPTDPGDGTDTTDGTASSGAPVDAGVVDPRDGRPATGETAAVDGIAAERAAASGGSPLPTVLTVLFVLIAGGVVVVVGRRRSARSDPNP